MQMCILPIPVCVGLGDGLRGLLGGGSRVGRWRVGDGVTGQPVCGIGRHSNWLPPIHKVALLYQAPKKGVGLQSEEFGKELGRITVRST